MWSGWRGAGSSVLPALGSVWRKGQGCPTWTPPPGASRECPQQWGAMETGGGDWGRQMLSWWEEGGEFNARGGNNEKLPQGYPPA